jgi:hypothetical protein
LSRLRQSKKMGRLDVLCGRWLVVTAWIFDNTVLYRF